MKIKYPSPVLTSLLFVLLIPCLSMGSIIYSGDMNTGLGPVPVSFDFNSDERDDLTLWRNVYIDPIKISDVFVTLSNSTEVLTGFGYSAVERLTPISSVAPSGFQWIDESAPTSLFSTKTRQDGWGEPFGPDGNAFIGVKFNTSNGTHFGWVEIYEDAGEPIYDVKIKGWAYESTPDTAIQAGVIPEPSTIGLLGVSSIVLLLHRSKRKIGRTRTWS